MEQQRDIDELSRLVGEGSDQEILSFVKILHPADLADLVEVLDDSGRRRLFGTLDAQTLADVFSEIEDPYLEELLHRLRTDEISQIVSGMDSDDAADVLSELPPEKYRSVIASLDEDGYRINLGQYDYKIRRGSEFRYMAANLDSTGRVKGFREAGTLRVVKTDESSSWAEIANIGEGEEIKVGDKVVRLAYLDEEREATKDSFTLFAQGGFPPDQKPLWGVNIYLDNTWVGTTGSDGKVIVPVRLFEEYELLLTRHGYQQVRDTLIRMC